MSDKQAVLVDQAYCNGCGACVEECPSEAITLVQSKARIDEERCTGCGVCVDACPEGAIQPVIQGELILPPERPAPTAYRPGPLAETAGVAAVATGVGLLAKAARALAQAAGRWLQQPASEERTPTVRASSSRSQNGAGRGSRNGAGRGSRARRRRRGG